MYTMTKRKVIRVLNQYPIQTLPIPIYAIEDILSEKGFSIINVDGISKPCIYQSLIYVPKQKRTDDYRYSLAHELGHIICQVKGKSAIDTPNKHEAIADAFALFFTMPPSLFELDMKNMNKWDLSEKYGIPIEQISNRCRLCEGTQYH